MKRVKKRVRRMFCGEFSSSDRGESFFFENLERRTLFAAVLVADINTFPSSDYHPLGLTPIGNAAYFTQHDGIHGDELWRTDGTAAGTVMIKDLFPGLGSGAPNSFAAAPDGTIFFQATDGASGYELWKTDGTESGTVLVKDINPGASNSIPSNLAAVGNSVYFFADDGVYGRELWVSDGSQAGTQLVTDLAPGTTGQTSKGLVALGGNLYFFATNGSQSGLWKSSGAPGNSLLLKSMTAANQITVFDGRLYFTDSGGYVWTSDGTAGGTFAVQNINSAVGQFVNTGDALFFNRATGTGAGVYRIQAGSTGPVSVGTGFSSPSSLANVDGNLYFTAKSASSGALLYRVNQFETTASMVSDIAPGNSQAFLSNLTGVGGTLYFTAYNPTDGYVLWEQPNSSFNPVLIRSLKTGGNFAPNSFCPVGNRLVFSNDGATTGLELWSSDGTSAGTGLIRDTYPGTATSDPYFSAQFGNNLFFRANDGIHGSEPMLLDSAGNLTSLGDLDPGTKNSYPFAVAALGVKTLFFATTTALGRELWITDGTAGGTALLKDIATGTASSDPSSAIVFNGRMYFSANDVTHGEEMWVTDGTAGGTVLFNDILTGTGSGGFSSPVVMNGVLYFVAADQAAGAELWRSDGTPGGTSRVTDIYPGSSGSAPANLTAFKDALYFTATDPANGVELWRSDGVTATLVKNIRAGSSSSSPANLLVAGDYLYFSADDGSGKKAWRTDGTDSGTVLLSSAAASPYSFAEFNGRAYFFATNASKGIDLWQSAGTPLTTSVVHAIMPPPQPNVSPLTPVSLTTINGRLFFLADDGTTGLELWSSDGTAADTALVQDLTPGTIQGILGNQIIDFNGQVYVDGNDSVSGFEPYRFPDVYAPVMWNSQLNLTSAPKFILTFNEAIIPPVLSDLSLVNLTTGATVASEKIAINYDAAARTLGVSFPGYAHGVPPDGNYRVTFLPRAIADLSGNKVTGGLIADFFYLSGDANHDRAVNFNDLVAVAQHYGQTGRSYDQGDFDFDGVVGFSDLVAVAQRYGTVLAPPATGAVVPDGSIDVFAPVRSEAPLIKKPPAAVKQPSPPIKKLTK